MMSSVSSLSLCWTLSLCLLVSVSAVPVNITVEPGDNVSLPCRAPNNTDVLEWTRPELEPGYVLMIRDGRPDPYNQLPSFKDRVELKDREMKDGDVSIILKNVTTEDAGRYECRVDQGKTIIVQGYVPTEPISIVYLEVQPGGTGGLGDKGLQIGLGVGLPLFVVIVGGI